MRVKFWGTRGSIPKPGVATIRYGGNTSCVEIRSSRGTLIVIDCGTGAHGLGQSLLAADPRGMRGHLLISHTHWDHIQGLPFFGPLFAPGSEWDVYGPKGLDQSIREALAGQMQYRYFPITLEQFGATVRYHDLVEGMFEIDDFRLAARYLNHPALTLGYRLEADNSVVVYACDHEPHSRAVAMGREEIGGQDERHAEFLRSADLLLHDAQYSAKEYPAKIGWGHSPMEYALRIAQHSGVATIALTHHDPLRDDDSLDRIIEEFRSGLRNTRSTLKVLAAAEGQWIEVTPAAAHPPKNHTCDDRAEAAISSAYMKQLVLLAVGDPKSLNIFTAVLNADGIALRKFSDLSQVAGFVQEECPSLVVLEHDPPRVDGLAICQAIRHGTSTDTRSLPVAVVAAREDMAGGEVAGVTEWILKPFSEAYVRTKVHAWILRRACRWVKAQTPEDEERRLGALHSLGILDTDFEPRFDRITRLAAALFDAPIALVSLVDRERQWFKSSYGIDVRETPRDAAFCAHVVYRRAIMIVPDTLRDPRFADNPLVTGPPHIRFYAGAPLILNDGSCVGTLCVIDTRVRSPEAASIGLLQDLRDLVVQELQRDFVTST